MLNHMEWEKKFVSRINEIRSQIYLHVQSIRAYCSFDPKKEWQKSIKQELFQIQKGVLNLENELVVLDDFCRDFLLNPQVPDNLQSSEDPFVKIRHDLRTPVNSIKGNNELILEILEEEKSLENCSGFVVALEIVGQILKLIDQVVFDSVPIRSLKTEDVDDSNKLPKSTKNRREGDSKLILVVDDAVSNRELLSKWLYRKNYRVLLARDGEDALRCIREHKDIDVILLDIIMPKADGYQVLNQIKQNFSHRHIPVIMISAVDDIDSIVYCIEAGAEDYLIKPFNSYLLDARIKACIDKQEAHMREKNYAEQLERETAYINSVINTMNNMLIVTNSDFSIQTVNRAAKEVLGYTDADCMGKSIEFIFKNKKDFKYIKQLCNSSESNSDIEVVFKTKKGEYIDGLISHSNIFYENGRVKSIIFVCRNVSHLKRMQEQLLYQATHDSLTGLLNRSLMHDKISDKIFKAEKMGAQVGIVILDLDNFKGVNDTFGHEGGDILLQRISERLCSVIRKEDLIFRFGGDEFIIVLTAKTFMSIDNIIRRYVKKISEPLDINGHMFSVTISAGVSVFPGDGPGVDMLIKKADSALYEVKKAGRNNIVFYIEDIENRVNKVNNL